MSQQSLLLCHDCDLLMENRPAEAGDRVVCSRCKALLYDVRPDSVNRVMAYSLTGLVLYIPANILPIMTLSMVGRSNSNTMVNGVEQLLTQGYWWMAILVLLCSVVVPLLELGMLFTLGLSIKLNRWKALSFQLLKWQGSIKEWGMLEVYMLGILVAFIKMRDLGDLHIGAGLLSFIGLLFITVLASVSFDRHYFWGRIDEIER